MPLGTPSETTPDNLPVDLEAKARWLAEDHNSRAQLSNKLQNSASGKAHSAPGSIVLLSASLPRLNSILKEASARFQAQTSSAGQLSLAAEWLLDNYYIAAQALREVKQDLPSDFERQLPRLQAGPVRVYDISVQIIQTENALIDLERVQRFVKAYQEVLPLTMGELWALPTMLRLGILESLLTAVTRLTNLDKDAIDKENLELTSNHMSPVQLDDQRIVESAIRSLRTLAVYDWNCFFEALSLVEITLRQDPTKLYSGMEFETRDRYRKVVEEIANSGQEDELSVAQTAVSMARSAADQYNPNPDGSDNLQDHSEGWDGFSSQLEAHIGYYLLGQGRPALEETAGYTPHGWQRLERFIRRQPTPFYLGTITCLTLVLIMIALVFSNLLGASTAALLWIFILGIIPAITLTVDLVNWAVTQILKPQDLPHMDFSRGLPEECASIVVIPAMLTEPDEVNSLVAQLEQHYLRNPDPLLFFVLLTDFTDSPTESQPTHSDLVGRARQGIFKLNKKYPWTEPGRINAGRFAFLHRERRWNASEGVWMGWERKRGKLHELNRLIQEARTVSLNNHSMDIASSFPIHEGDLSFLQRVRYVITLDADTLLPRDAARELIAVLAHPLSRARLKPAAAGQCGEEVVSGYTILQPRVDINPLSSAASYFTQIFSGNAGLDLYTRAVSDVYQDLFAEGSYVGKGAYEVDTFEKSLKDCIPENSLLSHDLLEGIHGRTALVTSTTLIEDIPSSYLVHARRLHRWTRGDWQLLPWLFSPRLSTISRWKILDNLRRSLLPASLLLWFLVGWLVQPLSPSFFTLTGAVVLAISVFTGLFGAIRQRMSGHSAHQAEAGLKFSFFRWMLALVFLPYEAQITLDAILRTLTRLAVTHRDMLRWTTSAQVARRLGDRSDLAAWLQMALSPIIAITLVTLITLFRPAALAWASPLLVAWFFSPWIAIWVSRSRPQHNEQLNSKQRRELRRLARQTWLFFEQFIGPEDQWLPPDHFQETPLGVVAHRTSPTNIGLALLSALGAYDLGYLESLTLSTRLLSTLDTLEKLECYRGHFLNWYDTRTLALLQPRYVSTVDSGNLAACLLALRQGCLEVPDHKVLRWDSFEGLLDAIDLLDALFRDLDTASLQPAIQELRSALSSIMQAIQSIKEEPARWVELIFDLTSIGNGQVSRHSWSKIDQLIVELVENNSPVLTPEYLRRLRFYNRGARQQLNSIQRCIDLLMPWLSSLQTLPTAFQDLAVGSSRAVAWQGLKLVFSDQPSLNEIPTVCRLGRLALKQLKDSIGPQDAADWNDAQNWLKRTGR